MKQVVQNYKTGELALLDVPEPACKPGGVLVRTIFSQPSMQRCSTAGSVSSANTLSRGAANVYVARNLMSAVRVK